MTIVDTYDNFTFTLMIVFLFICLFSIITLIMFNIKSRKLKNPKLYTSGSSSGGDSSSGGSSSGISGNSVPTLQCTPRQTLVGNLIQTTC